MRQIMHFTRWGLLCSPASLSAFQALLELQSVGLQLLSNLTRSLILLVVVWFYDKCNIQCNIFLPTGIGLSGLPPSIPQQICNGVLQVPFSLFAAFFFQTRLLNRALLVEPFCTSPSLKSYLMSWTFLQSVCGRFLLDILSLWLMFSVLQLLSLQVFFVIFGFAVFCVTLIGHGHAHGLGHAHQHQGLKEM